MGEDWQDYFKHFPDHDPANYDKDGGYDPSGQQRNERQRQELAHKRLNEEAQKNGATGTTPIDRIKLKNEN